jgi:very-short-patch-repair endonuclease
MIKKKFLINFARDMRNEPTKAEQKLWRVLKNEKSSLGKFRRQHPFGNKYIVDFVSLEHRLVIEIDGDGHDDTNDAARDLFIQNQGYRIARFNSDDILSRMPWVIETIANIITPSALLRKAPPPSPALPDVSSGRMPRGRN